MRLSGSLIPDSLILDIKYMSGQGYKPGAIALVCNTSIESVKSIISHYEIIQPRKQRKVTQELPRPSNYFIPSVTDDTRYACHINLPDDPYDAVWDLAVDSYYNPDIDLIRWRKLLISKSYYRQLHNQNK